MNGAAAPQLIVGSRDDLEAHYGAELEGPYGLVWFSSDGRMIVWSYRTMLQAGIAARKFERGFRQTWDRELRVQFL